MNKKDTERFESLERSVNSLAESVESLLGKSIYRRGQLLTPSISVRTVVVAILNHLGLRVEDDFSPIKLVPIKKGDGTDDE